MGFFDSVAVRVGLFIIFSGGFVLLSWRPLCNPRSHGFYRVLAFEAILALVLLNLPFWFSNPFSWPQLLSWTLLFSSLVFVTYGVYLLKKIGGHRPRLDCPENFAFENTAHLVTEGIYRYIRHPMYGSLLFLAWGACLKHVTVVTLAVAGLSTGVLVIAARVEERESLAFFGERYAEYARRTKMFIPFLF